MLANSRVIWGDNGTLKDLSVALNNYFSDTAVIDFVAADDYLYLGSDVPFNHRYFSMKVVNALDSEATVEIWDGNSWVPAVDVIDFTGETSKSLGVNGILKWTTDRNKSWTREESTELMTASGLTTLKIYGMYWVRLSWDNDWTPATELKYIGHRFSNDEDLGGHYPDLNRTNVMTAFQAAKTSWEEQHIMAAEKIVSDLRVLRNTWSINQIFEWEPFVEASVHKVAQIIFTAFGEKYAERRDDARDSYKEALESCMDQGQDEDEDGHLDVSEEIGGEVGVLVRR